jgi:hypothetical protein
LEGQVEEDNTNINETFETESDRLIKENEFLNAELKRYWQFHIPQSLQQEERPRKRVARMSSPEHSPEEDNTFEARVRIIFI